MSDKHISQGTQGRLLHNLYGVCSYCQKSKIPVKQLQDNTIALCEHLAFDAINLCDGSGQEPETTYKR